jgi:phosphoglycerate kinase
MTTATTGSVSASHLGSTYPGGERIRRLTGLDVANRQVFVRVDFNVPLKNKDGVRTITDDTRIRAALPTINYLREKGAKIICASHLGRPKGAPSEEFTLEPVAVRLGELLGADVLFAHDCVGDAVARQARDLKPGEVMVLENLRFHAGEEKNDPAFAHRLKELCEVYVNDAFGTCHRAHASTAGLPGFMKEKGAGFLLENEINALGKLVHDPDRPLVSILGGAKVSDKVKVIEALMVKSSKILIGGAMAYTFLRALKVQTGNSRVEVDLIPLATKILERSKQARCEIVLPMDHVMGKSYDNPGDPIVSENAHIPEGLMALDIGPRTRELFKAKLQDAATIFWNGPLGVFEKPPFDEGTRFVAQVIADSKAKSKICGGGDSVAAIHQAGLESGFTHISTGGGASLEMVEGLPMPGIEALKVNPA